MDYRLIDITTDPNEDHVVVAFEELESYIEVSTFEQFLEWWYEDDPVSFEIYADCGSWDVPNLALQLYYAEEIRGTDALKEKIAEALAEA